MWGSCRAAGPPGAVGQFGAVGLGWWKPRGAGWALWGSVGQRKVGGRAGGGQRGGSNIEGTSGWRGPGAGHSRAGMVFAPQVLGMWGGTGADPDSPRPGVALRCRRGTGVARGPESPQQLRVEVWPSRGRVFPCHVGVGRVGSGNAVLRPEWLGVTPAQSVTGFTGGWRPGWALSPSAGGGGTPSAGWGLGGRRRWSLFPPPA